MKKMFEAFVHMQWHKYIIGYSIGTETIIYNNHVFFQIRKPNT